LFHAAGACFTGHMDTAGSALHITRPMVLYGALWIACLYFLYQYWRAAQMHIPELFRQELEAQLRWLPSYFRIALEYLPQAGGPDEHRNQAPQLLDRRNESPLYSQPPKGLASLNFSSFNRPGTGNYTGFRLNEVRVPSERFRAMRVHAFFYAVYFESTFTD